MSTNRAITTADAPRLYIPNGPAVLVLGSDTVHGQAGVWVRREAADAPEYFAAEDFLKTGFYAYPPNAIRPADAARHADAVAKARELRVTHTALRLAEPRNELKLSALRAVLACTDSFRGGVVPGGGSRFGVPTARALVRLDLLTEHTAPHKGYRITDLGKDVLREAGPTRRSAASRRCDAPSTKNATSAGHYTTCPGWLDESGDCPEAGGHVRL